MREERDRKQLIYFPAAACTQSPSALSAESSPAGLVGRVKTLDNLQSQPLEKDERLHLQDWQIPDKLQLSEMAQKDWDARVRLQSNCALHFPIEALAGRSARTLDAESLPHHHQLLLFVSKGLNNLQYFLTEDIRVDIRVSLSCREGSRTPICICVEIDFRSVMIFEGCCCWWWNTDKDDYF